MSIIDGTYKTEASTPTGKQDGKVTLKTDGDSLSGTVVTSFHTLDFTGGKVTGNKFDFEYKGSSPLGKAKFIWSGTVDGDNISGVCKVHPAGIPLPLKSSFKGKRVKS